MGLLYIQLSTPILLSPLYYIAEVCNKLPGRSVSPVSSGGGSYFLDNRFSLCPRSFRKPVLRAVFEVCSEQTNLTFRGRHWAV